VEDSGLWDKQVFSVQVTDMKENALEIRVLVSAADSGRCWDLRCEVREKLIEFIRTEYPGALPQHRLAALTEGAVSQNGQQRPDPVKAADVAPH